MMLSSSSSLPWLSLLPLLPLLPLLLLLSSLLSLLRLQSLWSSLLLAAVVADIVLLLPSLLSLSLPYVDCAQRAAAERSKEKDKCPVTTVRESGFRHASTTKELHWGGRDA